MPKAPDTPSIDVLLEMIRKGVSNGPVQLSQRLMLRLYEELGRLKAERDELREDAELFRYWATTGRGYSLSHTLDGIRKDLAMRKAKERPAINWRAPELDAGPPP